MLDLTIGQKKTVIQNLNICGITMTMLSDILKEGVTINESHSELLARADLASRMLKSQFDALGGVRMALILAMDLDPVEMDEALMADIETMFAGDVPKPCVEFVAESIELDL
jgi:hypothetical protein